MPFCFKTRTTTWEKSIGVGLDRRQYTVELIRQIGCCGEAYRLFVNSQELRDHDLTYNKCSPLCGAGGQFEFEQDGHVFLVMYNSLSWRRFGEFHLFIDGIDVDSEREFSAFWRRYGWRRISLGLVLVFFGIVLFLVLHFNLPLHLSLSLVRLPLAFAIAGIVNIIIGITIILKYRRPRYSGLSAVEPTPLTLTGFCELRHF